MTYYNEHDRFCAQWLQNLIAEGLIADGKVDTRSIVDVTAADLRGFRRCHFFAGIAGWEYAAELAGWPADRELWTGSCPCQPFSVAGQNAGTDDPRDLWSAWFELIQQRRPTTIAGEQVSGTNGLYWIDRVFAALENIGYAVAAADLPAAGVGAFHKRQRIYFAGMADDDRAGWEQQRENSLHREGASGHHANGCGAAGALAYPSGKGLEGLRRHGDDSHESGWFSEEANRPIATPCTAAATAWTNCEWLPCRDGKSRPAEPGVFPLADGISARVGRLRAYGNAIVPQVGAVILRSLISR